jgi:hypothetical protein
MCNREFVKLELVVQHHAVVTKAMLAKEFLTDLSFLHTSLSTTLIQGQFFCLWNNY